MCQDPFKKGPDTNRVRLSACIVARVSTSSPQELCGGSAGWRRVVVVGRLESLAARSVKRGGQRVTDRR
jgi:hypothetical protein